MYSTTPEAPRVDRSHLQKLAQRTRCECSRGVLSDQSGVESQEGEKRTHPQSAGGRGLRSDDFTEMNEKITNRIVELEDRLHVTEWNDWMWIAMIPHQTIRWLPPREPPLLQIKEMALRRRQDTRKCTPRNLILVTSLSNAKSVRLCFLRRTSFGVS